MLRLVGAVLLLGGTAAVGVSAVQRLRARTRALRELIGALELMEQELSFRLTPMPELLARTARRSREPVSRFLQTCADKLNEPGEGTLAELWNDSAAAVLDMLRPEDLEALCSVSGFLGRYDSEGQQAALARAREALSQSLARAEEEQQKQGKVYSALGVTTGAFLVILLL